MRTRAWRRRSRTCSIRSRCSMASARRRSSRRSAIKQNREALQRGKMENRELRIALAQIKDAGAAGTEDETAKLTDLCSELRKCYDDLRNDAAKV